MCSVCYPPVSCVLSVTQGGGGRGGGEEVIYVFVLSMYLYYLCIIYVSSMYHLCICVIYVFVSSVYLYDLCTCIIQS